MPIPAGYPSQTSSAAVWSGKDLQLQDLVVELSPEDVSDVDDALAKVKGL